MKKLPLPASILTNILLCDGVGPAIVPKHLIGQINYPVTLNVTHLKKKLKKKRLVKISCHTYMYIKIYLILSLPAFLAKSLLNIPGKILSELISKTLPEGAS